VTKDETIASGDLTGASAAQALSTGDDGSSTAREAQNRAVMVTKLSDRYNRWIAER
jgi:hypothetical protein